MLDRRWVGFVAGVFISLLSVVILFGFFLVLPSRFRTTIVASLFPYDLKLEIAQKTRPQITHDIHGDVHPKSGGHDHGDHGDHGDKVEVFLSSQARNGIGLREGAVSVKSYSRPVIVPGIIVEKPGRSQYTVIAPITGYVTQVYQTPGRSVSPGDPLFELRLTHEELVQLQVDLLATSEALDVVQRELRRLESINTEGLIAKKRILDQQYELQKLEGRQLAQRQALLLHGLSGSQVKTIQESRTLLGTVIVRAPYEDELVIDDAQGQPMLLLQQLDVERGQYVETGVTLAVLVDHQTLLIDAEAFEKDAIEISEAASEGRPVVAMLETASGESRDIPGLTIDYLASEVDAEARTLHFFVSLPNEKLSGLPGELSSETLNWRYRPGQRVRLRVPIEEWPDRMVVPATAVAEDGVEHYVFIADGDHFHQQAVEVEFRDPKCVVLANDGSIHPGDIIALTAAQQLQFALKSQSGTTVDHHSGHTH